MKQITGLTLGAVVIAAAVVGGRWLLATPSAVATVESDRGVATADTSREGLAAAIAALESRVAADPSNEPSAVGLAEALLRSARVEGNPALPIRAEKTLRATIRATDGYAARRMLGAVLLAQHRFAEALSAGRAAQAMRPDDPWNYGVVGDAALELGRYEEAFAAFDRMVALRPNASSYARIAYARELQGDLDGAVLAMQRAIEATSPRDAEALAWQWSQIGALERMAGRLDRAELAYRRALHAFPGHSYARTGRARVMQSQNDIDGAMREFQALYHAAPTPELAAAIGDIHASRGDRAKAVSMWSEAEQLEREGWKAEEPQPAALAAMLAERDLKIPEAVRLARLASASRDDIHTNDALAVALLKAGDLEGARQASLRARRTGTRDPRILAHASAIDAAMRGE
jgi:tetratricopeptide (TPR) repeat protein